MSFSRLFTIGELSASYTANAPPSRTTVLMPETSSLSETDWPSSCSLSSPPSRAEMMRCSPPVVLDDREVRDIQLEEPRQLIQENPRDRGRPVGVEQLMREAADSCDLAVAA